jgi:molybdopterin-guanine dinucleotide biosynthesis protein A
MPEVSAVVLAGGKSQRLGMDKSLLRFEGEWLLQRILSQLSTLSTDLLVVANDGEKLASLKVPVVPDARPGMGPLGGIYSGLQSIRCERGLFVACDMPLLNLQLLQYMVRLSPEFDVVIPRVGDETEPLHAIYSKACLQPVADLLDRGQRRVIHFFDRVRVRYIEPEEIEVFDPEHLSFFNINTPADLQLAKELSHRATRAEPATPGTPVQASAGSRTLVIGYGNLDRADDGVAYHVVKALRERLGQKTLSEDETGLQGLGGQTDSILLTQLVPELIHTLADYQRVIFVDAHVHEGVPDLYCSPVSAASAAPAFSHHLTPAVLLALLKTILHVEPMGHIVSIRAYDFAFHRHLSDATALMVQPAVEHILRQLNSPAGCGLEANATDKRS